MVHHGWGVEVSAQLHLELHSVQVRGRCVPRIMVVQILTLKTVPKITITNTVATSDCIPKNLSPTHSHHRN